MVLVAISSIHNAVGQFQSIAIQDAVSEYILSVLFMFVRTFHRDTTIITWGSIGHQKMTRDQHIVNIHVQKQRSRFSSDTNT